MIAAFARALLLGALLGASGLACAQAPVPALSGHVVDQAGLLDSASKANLEQTLAAFEARKGSQVAVLVVPTTAPEAIEPYALRVAEQWKLGRKKVDDGAILVVAKDDHALRIEVGYGLEGALNDATCKRIIDEIIVPRFLQQDFAGGITAGVDRMLRVIDGEPLPAPQWKQRERVGGGDVSSYLPIIVVVALVVGSALRAMLGRLAGSVVTGGVVAVAVWWLAGAVTVALAAGVMALFFTLFGGMGLLRAGGLGGFGGGGRGGGGGGFSGGGGGFGGGGASGRW